MPALQVLQQGIEAAGAAGTRVQIDAADLRRSSSGLPISERVAAVSSWRGVRRGA
jgi:hypothetical protein